MNRKKIIITTAALVCATAWCTRYYVLNGTFAVHNQSPVETYGMQERVEFGDCMSYGQIYTPGYAISVESCRVIDAEDYRTEMNKTAEDFEFLADRYVEVTLNVANLTNEAEGMDFYSIPLIGTNWYAFYDQDATAYINPFYQDQREQAFGAAVKPDSEATIKIAYSLYEDMFSQKQWDNLTDENMWIWTTISPVEKHILLDFS